MRLYKKHFKAIAEIIRKCKEDTANPDTIEGIASLANNLTDYFKDEIPTFNPDKFLKACGLSQSIAR